MLNKIKISQRKTYSYCYLSIGCGVVNAVITASASEGLHEIFELMSYQNHK